jgi:hypothetical protein
MKTSAKKLAYAKQYREKHKEKIRAYLKEWYRKNKPLKRVNSLLWRRRNPQKSKDSNLRSLYGITLADYQAMFNAQGGVCLFCKRPGAKLGVDHDHETGKVRGLLCNPCNGWLGHVEKIEGIGTVVDEYIKKGGGR